MGWDELGEYSRVLQSYKAININPKDKTISNAILTSVAVFFYRLNHAIYAN